MSSEKLQSATANWQRGQASARMTQWLEQLGGAIEAVFANNDDMALGAIDALPCRRNDGGGAALYRWSGRHAAGAGSGGRPGTLKGTVRNDAAGQARSIVDLSCALLDGRSASSAVTLEDGKYVWLAYTAVTAENLEQFRQAQ